MIPLNVLPEIYQRDFMASLQRYIDPDAKGHFYLVDAKLSGSKDWQSQKITVLVLDENGFSMPNVRVAFSYSTADQYVLTPNFLWTPPSPPRAFVVPTQGSGMIDQVQGSSVKAGQPGGVTVYCFEPEWSSDVVTGLGMLADHVAPILTFQLRRNGVVPLEEWKADIERRLAALEGHSV